MAKWKTLQHNGIQFPKAYETKGIKIRIRGQSVEMNLDQEEMAYQWAKKKDTPYAQDPVFRKNFTSDFLKALGNPAFRDVSYEEIDFDNAYRLVDREKEEKKEKAEEKKKRLAAMTREQRKAERERLKAERERLKAELGTAMVDGKPVEMGNYMAEPPGIFIGRGQHPVRGRWKPRITARDVTLNLGREARVPDGDWGKIVHERDSMWLASWIDRLTQKRKYIWLADTAGLKQDMDRAKYEKAVMLADRIGKVKASITRDMKSDDPKKSRIATVCYLIYRTAMRVGDEKDPDEADTVGATTLRKEHIRLTDESIEFDFLGKDSVRWQETVMIGDGHDRQFQANLARISGQKKPRDEIFDGITSRHVNAYYSGIVKGLTAKVFRTYLATTVVRRYLEAHDDIADRSVNEKTYHAKMANLEAATMCNHKRTIPKTFEESLQKRKEKLRDIQRTEAAAKAMQALKKARQSEPKTGLQKKRKAERIRRIKEQIKRQTERHAQRVERMKLQIDLSERTRDYNLGTSLRNYIDPRVVRAWSDHVGAEWEKMYTAALQKKFLWVGNEDLSWDRLKAEQAAR